jgi:hypothetical protein
VSLVSYGWTVTRIRAPLYTFDGGTLDRSSNATRALDGAQLGEIWCVRVDHTPHFMLGEITVAHRSCAAVAGAFTAGRRFDGLDHCPCD